MNVACASVVINLAINIAIHRAINIVIHRVINIVIHRAINIQFHRAINIDSHRAINIAISRAINMTINIAINITVTTHPFQKKNVNVKETSKNTGGHLQELSVCCHAEYNVISYPDLTSAFQHTLFMSHHNTSRLEAESVTELFRQALQGYLGDISFQIFPLEYDERIEQGLLVFLHAQQFPTDEIRHTMPIVKWSACIAACTYPLTSIEVRVVIAIFTYLAIAVDDMSKKNLADLKAFHTRLLRGEKQPSALLRAIVPYIELQRRVYGSFISDLITTALWEFINGCIIEMEYDAKLSPTPHTPEFPYYLRIKTGVAEAYALFAFPLELFPEKSLPRILPLIPGLIRYFDLNNDFLSFYKESIVSNEGQNYMCNYAATRNITPMQALEETRRILVKCVMDLRNAARDTNDANIQQCIEYIVNGYIMYHFSATRYRLSDFDIQQIEDMRKMLVLG